MSEALQHSGNEYFKNTTFRDGRERGLWENEVMLRFDVKELEGKKVLNLGSGENLKLEKEIAEAGVKSTVVSLNPDFAYEGDEPFADSHEYTQRIRSLVKDDSAREGMQVAAIGQHLPFADNSFDEIFANHSLSVFSSPHMNLRGAEMWAREIFRVLRPGGKCRICPVEPKFFYEDNYHYLYEIWNELGANAYTSSVPTIEVLGEERQTMLPDGTVVTEKRDPNSVLYHTLIVEKPAQSK